MVGNYKMGQSLLAPTTTRRDRSGEDYVILTIGRYSSFVNTYQSLLHTGTRDKQEGVSLFHTKKASPDCEQLDSIEHCLFSI